MKRAIRTFVACLFAGIVAGVFAPRIASAHAELTNDEFFGRVPIHIPGPPRNLRVIYAVDELPRPLASRVSVLLNIRVQTHPDDEGTRIYATWDHGHSHDALPGYEIYLLKSPADTFEAAGRQCDERAMRTDDCPFALSFRAVIDREFTHIEAHAILEPETTYYLYISQTSTSAQRF